MRNSLFIILLLMFFTSLATKAQTAEEIIEKFIRLNGGDEKLDQIRSLRWYGTIETEKATMKISAYKMRDGRQATFIMHDGLQFVHAAFDGDTLWSTDLNKDEPKVITGAPVDRLKAKISDFPIILQHYKEEKHDVSYQGVVNRDDNQVHKIKLTTLPYIIGGNAILFDHYYYFDKETFYPIAVESSLGNGSDMTVQSDFKEVEGYYFPHRISQAGETINIVRIDVNPYIDTSIFIKPEPKKRR